MATARYRVSGSQSAACLLPAFVSPVCWQFMKFIFCLRCDYLFKMQQQSRAAAGKVVEKKEAGKNNKKGLMTAAGAGAGAGGGACPVIAK